MVVVAGVEGDEAAEAEAAAVVWATAAPAGLAMAAASAVCVVYHCSMLAWQAVCLQQLEQQAAMTDWCRLAVVGSLQVSQFDAFSK
jgi:hypothetical protein